MAGFQSEFTGNAPPKEAVKAPPNPIMSGLGTMFELLASGKKDGTSNADLRAMSKIQGREDLFERANELSQQYSQGVNISQGILDAQLAATKMGVTPSEISSTLGEFGIPTSDVLSARGGNNRNFGDMVPDTDEIASFIDAVRQQNPGFDEEQAYAEAHKMWVQKKRYEDDYTFKNMSDKEAWTATKEYALGEANRAFWSIYRNDLAEDNQVKMTTLHQLREVMEASRQEMQNRWESREGSLSSSRERNIGKLFVNFERAITTAEEGLLLEGAGVGELGHKTAAWLMTTDTETLVEIINDHYTQGGGDGFLIDPDENPLTPSDLVTIGNWIKARSDNTPSSDRDVKVTNAMEQLDDVGNIGGLFAGKENLTGDNKPTTPGQGGNVAANLTYIYNAVVLSGTPKYLAAKRKEIDELASLMGFNISGVTAASSSSGSGVASSGGSGGSTTPNGAVGPVTTSGTPTAIPDVHPAVLFASGEGGASVDAWVGKFGERDALKMMNDFYDNNKILGGVTQSTNGQPTQIAAWQSYDSADPKVQEIMENQVEQAGGYIAHVLKAVTEMDTNAMDGDLQEKIMGSKRTLGVIRAMASSNVPGARETAVALAHMQGQAANKVVVLNAAYLKSVADTIDGTSYQKLIKPKEHGDPIEIQIDAFTQNEVLRDVDGISWGYQLNEDTPGNLRNLLEAIRKNDESKGNLSDTELLQALFENQSADQLVDGKALTVFPINVADRGQGPKWNTQNELVKELGVDKDGTVAGLTAGEFNAVIAGVAGIQKQLKIFQKADAARLTSLNAMQGAKALWTELTGQGFTEDGAPRVSLQQAALGITNTPDADTPETQVGEGEAGEDFGTFLQQFARERGYSEEEIAKTVADINAAGGSAAYIKAQKKENPAYFHEDVAAAIAAKPDNLWIEGEDGKLVQNPDADVEEARNSWELGVLDALRKIDPAFTLADAQEAASVATVVEASETPQRTPDELKVALERGEIDQATFDAEMAKMSGSEVDVGSAVEETPDDEITTDVLPDEATEKLIEGINEAIDASEEAGDRDTEIGAEAESKRVARELYEQEDVAALEKLVGSGDANAQYRLGQMYFYEKGVAKDDAEAMRLYRLAAEQGHVGAQNRLGSMYLGQGGGLRDDAEAFRWFSLAAEQGNASAQYTLGSMYANGIGVPQDDAEAVRWYGLAAEQGNVDAQNMLKKLESQADEERATVELGEAEKRLATMPVTKSLIERVESKPGLEGYKTLWSSWEQPGGRYEGTDITTMSLGQLFKFADDGYHNANGLNSAPFGKFQFLDSTLKDLINRMPGITEDTMFTPDNQVAMFTWYAKDRLGNRQGDAAVSKLVAIWEGLGKGDVAYVDILRMAGEIRGTPTEPPVPVKYTLPADTENTVGVGGITVAVNSIPRKNSRGEHFNAPPIFGTSGEHSHTPSPKNMPYAEGNMQKLMAENGPFHRVQAKMSGLFPDMKPVRINDALVHAGSTRENTRPPTGTKSGSQHFHGTALDVSIAGMTRKQKIALWKAAYEEGFRGFGFGNSILHMDMGNARIWGYGDIAKNAEWSGISFTDLRQGIVSAGPRGGDNFIVGARATFEGDTGDRAVEDKEGKQGDVEVISLGDYVLPQGIFGIPGMTAKSPEEIFFGEGERVPQALADDFGDPSAEDSGGEAPFMRRPPEERLAGPDDELKDMAWRKLEKSELEELIEVSEGDSGLRSQAAMSLGNRYQNGRGVPKDKDKAREFYESVVIDGGELAEEAATALEGIDNLTPSEATQLMKDEGRGTMIKGEPYILLPGGVVVRGRDGEPANDAITALVKKRLRVDSRDAPRTRPDGQAQ